MVVPTAKPVRIFTREDGIITEHYVPEVKTAWRTGFMVKLLNNSLAPKVVRGIRMKTTNRDPGVMPQVLLLIYGS